MFPRESAEMAQHIYDAYTKTFPGVIAYQKWCMQLFNSQNYGTNLYGRRYYGTNGHNGANGLIQGTGSSLLKEKIVEIDAFLIQANASTRMQMTVHDEIIFRVPKKEVHLIPQLQAIMENVPGTWIPIVAETEISETTWADKKGFDIYDGTRIEYHLHSD
jgi:DNA polymerase-1